jgi:hypothetical protein
MSARKEVPNPGFKDAVAKGCRCPVLDNARGRGAWGTSGPDAVFFINGACPLHRERPGERPEADRSDR